MWDSTGPRGGAGAKFARALVSEIIGFASVKGVRAGIRKDSLEIEVEGVPVYQAKDEVALKTGFDWTVIENEAKQSDGKPVSYAKKGKATELNHSNILVGTYSEKAGTFQNQEGQEIPGGFTISYALQTTVLSLPALRRLSFLPIQAGCSARLSLRGVNQAGLTKVEKLSSGWSNRQGWNHRVSFSLRILREKSLRHMFRPMTSKHLVLTTRDGKRREEHRAPLKAILRCTTALGHSSSLVSVEIAEPQASIRSEAFVR